MENTFIDTCKGTAYYLSVCCTDGEFMTLNLSYQTNILCSVDLQNILA